MSGQKFELKLKPNAESPEWTAEEYYEAFSQRLQEQFEATHVQRTRGDNDT